MLYPTLQQFIELSRQFRRVVVYREIAGDSITPISLLMNFSDEDNLFLLESANLDKSFSRYTFFGFRPRRTITYQNKTLIVESREAGIGRINTGPIDYLVQELSCERSNKNPGMGNFCGGYVGFIGYDIANYMGILREAIREDTENISMAFFQVDDFYVFDNHMGKLYAACSAEIGGDPEYAYRKAADRTLEMAAEIRCVHNKFFLPGGDLKQSQEYGMDSYMEAVRTLKEDIVSGECIQAVLSNKYEIACSINPINLYRLLRNINPSPYMFYIKVGGEVLCGTSPEIHLKIQDRTAILKPIAGTYRIDGGTIEEITARLLADEKERAEHLMLLDLARNDLYTGCKTDTVRVVSSFEPEVYSHLIHIVSEVRGEMRDDITPLRLFCNTFPAGTVSGAPKVRAMELIDRYEKSPRGFYAGCAGYFSYSQDIDTCIIIRSAYVKRDRVILRAGAGIVYDSDPENEYHEVGNKLGALFDAIKRIDTLEKRNVFTDR
ncbi:MAG: anthranilate synthase component I [Spirochaetes bacterium RBG_13_51_14]|nr:MAG: anthranilate synthase component I [Spirochaetes bacterium RBG_13_51_14]